MDPIITRWFARYSELFGHEPLKLEHNLNTNPLFSTDALSFLIDIYPEESYTLMRVGTDHADRVWTEGKLGTTTGRQALAEIAAGRLWLNLRHTQAVDIRYQQLLNEIYEEFAALAPGMHRTFKRICGIIISSPGSVVPYHFDTSGQNLWQIRGNKRVWVYPPDEPFLSNEQIERCTLYHDETSIYYLSFFDEHAKVFDLQPGTLLHWPLNSPHRIQNGDELSVSLTTEYYTDAIQRHVRAVSGNGLLREMGFTDPAIRTTGLPYMTRLGVFAAAKALGIIDRRRQHQVAFRLEAQGERDAEATAA